MKIYTKKAFSLLMSLAMIISLFSGLMITASAAPVTTASIIVEDSSGETITIASWTYDSANDTYIDDATNAELSIVKDFTDPANLVGTVNGTAYDFTDIGALAYTGADKKPDPRRIAVTLKGIIVDDIYTYAENILGVTDVLKGTTTMFFRGIDNAVTNTYTYDNYWGATKYYYPAWYATGNGSGGIVSTELQAGGRVVPSTLAIIGYNDSASTGKTVDNLISEADSARALRAMQGQQEGGASNNADANLGFNSVSYVNTIYFTLDDTFANLGIDTSAYYTYYISNQADLEALATRVNGGEDCAGETYVLTGDIALSGEWTPIGDATNAFAGTFDGAGYEISGLSITNATGGYKGLFGNNSGTVKDFNISGSIGSSGTPLAVTGDNVGGAVGYNDGTVSGIIGNVEIFVLSSFYAIGGIVGQNDGTISECGNEANVTGTNCVGGITGRNYGTVDLCYNTGNITGNGGGKDSIGGIVGRGGDNNTPTVTSYLTNCYNTGTISNPGGRWHGGIVGFANTLTTVTNCYNTGAIVSGHSWNWNPIIGHVDNAFSTVHSNYTLDTVNVGDTTASTMPLTVGTKKTEAEMQDEAFVTLINNGGDAFSFVSGGNYPVLTWQIEVELVDVTADYTGKVIYPQGGTVSEAALSVTAEYNTGDETLASGEYTLTYDFSVLGDATVTVSYDGFSDTFDVLVVDAAWYGTSMEIGTASELTAFAAIVNGTIEGIAQDDFSGKTVTLSGDIALETDGAFTKTAAVFGTTSHRTNSYHYAINAGANIWTPIGTGSRAASGHNNITNAQYFAGTFDGAGYTVSGVYTDGSQAVQGLFGCVSGTIKNLTVDGCVVGHSIVGGVAAYLDGGTIENCTNNAAVYANGGTTPDGGVENGTSRAGAVGGIVGRAGGNGFEISGCINNGDITCTNTNQGGRTGGIVGVIDLATDTGTITNCKNHGEIDSYQYSGGIVGLNNATNAPIDSCFNTGKVIGHVGTVYVGGIVAMSASDISNCYNTGTFAVHIDGTSGNKPTRIGGIVGSFSGSAITNCYNTGTGEFSAASGALAPGSIGGICGTGYGSAAANKMINCYTLENTEYENTDAFLTIVTDSELKSAEIAEDLGTEFILNCGGYPLLAWQVDEANTTHTNDAGVVTLAPTATVAGTRTFTCTICGHEHDEAIAATGSTSSGSGGGGIAAADKVTVNKANDGSVTVSSTSPANGSTVIITATPKDGFEVSNVVVTDKNGNTIAVTDNGNGTFSFVYGGSDVKIDVEFAPAEQGNTGDTTDTITYRDVAAGAWYSEAVAFATENGVMTGTSADTFSPNLEMSRAMLVTVIYRLEGEPAVSGAAHFDDVASGQWYFAAIAWASENGIANGVSDKTFAPNDDISREQMAAILFRYANYKGYDTSARADLSAYSDAGSVSAYAEESMRWATGAGLITGMENSTLSPNSNATRAQVATILMRFVEAFVN